MSSKFEVWYIPEAHAMEGFTKDTDFYGDWVNNSFCLHRCLDTDKVVGFFLYLPKSIHKIEQNPPVFTEKEHRRGELLKEHFDKLYKDKIGIPEEEFGKRLTDIEEQEDTEQFFNEDGIRISKEEFQRRSDEC